MPTDLFIEDDQANLAMELRAFRAEVGERARDIITDAVNIAAATMRAAVPFYEGELYRSIDEEPLTYNPGGFGGGGSYSTGITAGRGVEHFQWVVEGTGIFGPQQRPITPRTQDRMSFLNREGTRFISVPMVMGQKPKTEWITDSQEAAEFVIASRLRTMVI